MAENFSAGIFKGVLQLQN